MRKQSLSLTKTKSSIIYSIIIIIIIKHFYQRWHQRFRRTLQPHPFIAAKLVSRKSAARPSKVGSKSLRTRSGWPFGSRTRNSIADPVVVLSLRRVLKCKFYTGYPHSQSKVIASWSSIINTHNIVSLILFVYRRCDSSLKRRMG